MMITTKEKSRKDGTKLQSGIISSSHPCFASHSEVLVAAAAAAAAMLAADELVVCNLSDAETGGRAVLALFRRMSIEEQCYTRRDPAYRVLHNVPTPCSV